MLTFFHSEAKSYFSKSNFFVLTSLSSPLLHFSFPRAYWHNIIFPIKKKNWKQKKNFSFLAIWFLSDMEKVLNCVFCIHFLQTFSSHSPLFALWSVCCPTPLLKLSIPVDKSNIYLTWQIRSPLAQIFILSSLKHFLQFSDLYCISSLVSSQSLLLVLPHISGLIIEESLRFNFRDVFSFVFSPVVIPSNLSLYQMKLTHLPLRPTFDSLSCWEGLAKAALFTLFYLI